ncbi:MAG: hypothetical protein IPK50_06405 [Fibrobacterota bacterium]|nr:hypothetical protein [Fibrobacterota bacterium]QQS06523.1 MAG: hypothetical protein IPK50_06405 [Fibrobacterota bacterium]
MKILRNPNGEYELQSDIDFDSIKNEWKQIAFCGKFDGKNHAIKNIQIDLGKRSTGGLFRSIIGVDSEIGCNNSVKPNNASKPKLQHDFFSEFRNISIHGQVRGMNSLGILAGEISNAVIENIRTTGEVIGKNEIGGVAGKVGEFVKARNIESSAAIYGNDNVGGIFGKVFWVDFRGGISHCVIQGRNSVGGIVGILESSFVSSQLFDGSVIGNDTIGGIVGLSVGSNRRNSKLITIGTLPEWFSKNLEIGMPMDYASDYPPGGYSAFGNSECECSGLIYSDFHASNTRVEIQTNTLFESSMGDWLVDAIFRGKIRCINVCGGIRGSGKLHSLALHHAISTGEICGNKKIGGISGTGKSDLRFSDMINGSIGCEEALPMFGESPTSISWGIQLLPTASSSRTYCKSVYNNCKSPDTSIFSIGKMRWDGAYYPPGVLVPLVMDDEIKFRTIKPQLGWDSIITGMPSLLDSITNAEASGFQYWKHNSYSGSTNERFLMVDNFPPRLKKFKATFLRGCKPIDDFVELYNPNGFHLSILPDSSAWNISGNNICVNAESKTGSKAMLVIQRNNGGKSFLQLFKE